MRTHSDGRSGDSAGFVGGYRGVTIALLLVAGLIGGLAAGAAVGGEPAAGSLTAALSSGADGGVTEIDSCAVIDEPGQYELTGDVESDEGVCIHVRSDDVTLDGNGHTVSGTGNATDGSVGILVFNGSDGGERDGDELDNVTLRNVTVTDYAHGVRLGQIVGSGPTVTVENVTATGNGDGFVAFGAGESSLTDLTATGSERSGIVVWETASLDARDVTVTDNGVNGLVLDQSVLDSDFTGVTAADNGQHGIVVNTGSVNNTITDASLANNERAGITFSDSHGTILRDATIENNGGPGVQSDFGVEDGVENVTVAGNAIAYDSTDDQPRYGVLAEDVRLESGVVASFGMNVDSFGEAAVVPDRPDDATVAGPGVNLTVDQDAGAAQTTVRFPYDASVGDDEDDLTVWRYEDGTWQTVSDVSVDSDAAAVTATVQGGGVVVPVVSDDGSPPGDTPRPGEDQSLTANVTVDGTEFDCIFDVNGTTSAADVAHLPGDEEQADDSPRQVNIVAGNCTPADSDDGERTEFVLYATDPPAVLADGAENVTAQISDDRAR